MESANQQGRLSRDYLAGLLCGEAWFGLTVIRRPPRTLKTRNGFIVLPRIVIQMDDTETMLLTQASLLAHGLPVYVESTSRSQSIRLGTTGCRRCLRWSDFFLPVLTGQKRRAMETMRDYCVRRLSVPQNHPYEQADMDLVNRIRSLNAGNGKQRIQLREMPSET